GDHAAGRDGQPQGDARGGAHPGRQVALPQRRLHRERQEDPGGQPGRGEQRGPGRGCGGEQHRGGQRDRVPDPHRAGPRPPVGAQPACASPNPNRSISDRPSSDVVPNIITERSTTTPVSRANADQSSAGPAPPPRPPAARPRRPVADRPSAASTPAITRAGTASSGVPASPKESTTGVTATGPSARPMLPPTANQLIPCADGPATARTALAATGW